MRPGGMAVSKNVERDVTQYLYGLALNEDSWVPEEVARRFSVRPERIREIALSMEELGLISSAGGAYRVAGATPEALIARIVDEERESLLRRVRENEAFSSRMNMMATTLYELFREKQSAAGTTVVTGRERVSEVLEEVTSFASREIISMHPGSTPSRQMLQEGMRRNRQVLDQGVSMTCIHLLSMHRVPYADRHLKELQDAGVRLRLMPTLPFRMIIVDSSVAMVPAPDDPTSMALLIVRDPHTVRLLLQLFNFCWVSAVPRTDTPCEESSVGELSTQQQAVLRLLATGRTDEGISRELGISTRTLRRVMADLMSRLGVTSRFEAGVESQMRGLLN